MRELMRDLSWHDAVTPLVANVSGNILIQGAEIRHELVEQITSPVQWVSCVERLVAEGCDTLIELGSGQVLTKLVRLIAPQITAVAIDTPAKLEAFAKTQRADFSKESLQIA